MHGAARSGASPASNLTSDLNARATDGRMRQGLALRYRVWAALHIRIIRTAATLGRYPYDVLLRIFNVTSFTVHTILRIDL